MTTRDMTEASTTSVARSLAVLVPLIKQDLLQAREASERAGMPYYQSAGEKMLEAKPQMKQGDFGPWLRRQFGIGLRQAQFYMNFAKATAGADKRIVDSFTSLDDFIRKHGSPSHGRPAASGQAWYGDVKENIERAKREAEQWRQAELTRQQERDAERQLGLRLIDIGFKVLAKELHPDRGGSRDAMARLNRVRDRLKQNT